MGEVVELEVPDEGEELWDQLVAARKKLVDVCNDAEHVPERFVEAAAEAIAQASAEFVEAYTAFADYSESTEADEEPVDLDGV